MKTYFDAFGKLGRNIENTTLIAGRRLFLSNREKIIAEEVQQKLVLSNCDVVLEIGCGPGNLLFHLASIVKLLVGIDHPDLIYRARKKLSNFKNLELYPGNWFDININKIFDKIIIYSVIQYLETYENLIKFLDKALDSLADGGKILVGDIPNSSKMERFSHSTIFNIVEEEYKNKVGQYRDGETVLMEDVFGQVGQNALDIDDDLVLKVIAFYRRKGCDAYILPQNTQLPYGYSREDILICKGHIL
jgi:SAM-dependent methyltransferase